MLRLLECSYEKVLRLASSIESWLEFLTVKKEATPTAGRNWTAGKILSKEDLLLSSRKNVPLRRVFLRLSVNTDSEFVKAINAEFKTMLATMSDNSENVGLHLI
jgi:hypothetical protein